MTRPTGRGRSKLRDLPLIAWFVAAIAIAVAHRWLPDANWLMLHVVLLGAVTHSILVWSFHFAQTLLRSPATDAQARRHNVRLGLVTAGTAAVLIGVPSELWSLTLLGGTSVMVAVGWHGVTLWTMLRRALPARFRVTVHYYLCAAASLVVGAGFGVALAWGWPDPWHGRLLVAHALTNLLGWVGLTVAGTLLTLWPTMLRTRLGSTAERRTRTALPWLVSSVLVSAGGALAGLSWLSALGLVGYLGGLALWLVGLWGPVRKAPPREFAPASVAAALVWLVLGLGWAGWVLVTAPDWQSVREAFIWPATALAAGFGVQVLTGALSYLLPSVLGGGPSVVRAGQDWFNRGGLVRLIAINGGLALWLLPTASWVKVTGSVLGLIGVASFLPLMVLGLRASIAARRELLAQREAGTAQPDAQDSPGECITRPTFFTSGQLIAGLTALVMAVVIGVGVDPAAAGLGGAGATKQVAATGRTIRVDVSIVDMTYRPSSVQVAAGDRLVVHLVNTGATTHDLVIGSARTPRLAPGADAELDAGVIGASVEGYCSVVGHRQLGMVFQVIVDGGASPSPSGQEGMDGMSHDTHQPDSQAGESPGTAAHVVDPVLPALGSERLHRITLTVTEVPLEVAPGIWQRRWTYNGSPVGPTLHGRVGDTFVITLVNNGTMGHSIDFHAGALAPDRPMRTIEPGQRLTYRFTATKAGIWMYHCSTMPMSAHIAAGMAGAVVIEPDGLPAVDRSYLLVQSEVYLQSRAADAASATEVNAEAAGSAAVPDYVVFNGVANGYDSAKLTAKVGERVRFWVLDAGPNRASSFHIVGSQFDTVYREGAYQLMRGRDPFGGVRGGSQALGLLPAQGGFVEAVFPEAGRYPFVTHVMADAERGAHGFVQVSP